MKDALQHPHSKRLIENFLQNPSQASVLTGPAGSGKGFMSERLAEDLLGLADGTFESFPYGLKLSPIDGKAIGIDSVREVEHFLSRRVPSQKLINRVIIIENAHKLTLEAQNALLKMLEEPPSGSVFLLTATSDKLLLPTIRSRTQAIAIKPPAATDLESYFSRLGHSKTDIKQAYSMSAGLPGLMTALLTNQSHPLKEAAEKAKQLLSQSSYDRLQTVDALAKQNDLLSDILFIMQQMARLSLLEARGQASQRWQRILKGSYQAEEELRLNGQPKLVLTKLMLAI